MGAYDRKKHAKQAHNLNLSLSKRPRITPTHRDGEIEMSFRLFDWQTRWIGDGIEDLRDYDAKSHFMSFVRKLGNYETMKWPDIFQRDHPIKIGDLCPRAQRRLIDLRMDDIDELWRLAFEGRVRIWGWRHLNRFYAIWWDPLHRVYPIDIQDR